MNRKKEVEVLIKAQVHNIKRLTETLGIDEDRLIELDREIAIYQKYRNELKTLK